MTATMSAVDPAPAGAPTGRGQGPTRSSRVALWGWILPIRVGQVAVWQLCALAVLATLPWAPGPTMGVLRPAHIAVIAAAGVGILVTSFRFNGLCFYQWMAVYYGYRGRKAAIAEQQRSTAKQRQAQQRKTEPQAAGKPNPVNPENPAGNGGPNGPWPGGPVPGSAGPASSIPGSSIRGNDGQGSPRNPHSGFPSTGAPRTGNALMGIPPGRNQPGGNPPSWPGNPNQGRPGQTGTPPFGWPRPDGPNGQRPPGPGGPGGPNPAIAHFGGPNPGGGGDFPDGDPLVTLLPGLTTRRYIDRAGNRVGLAHVDDGWTAVLRLASAARPSPAALVSTMRSIYQRTDVPLSSVGLVVWTMPGPLDLDPADQAPKAQPIRVFWLAVRYRPADAPLAALARGGDEIGAMRATASAVMRLAAELSRLGLGCSVLDEPELRQDLLIALGCDRAAGSAVQETWRTWSVGRIRQSCFGLRRSRDIVVALNRWAPGAAFSSTSLLIRRNSHGKVRRDLTVRIGLPRNPRARPEHLAAGLNIGLVPLHGRHGKHVRASLPLGLSS